ncbi:hypothetical protein SARC_09051 [Sphaeroforma arctica JP610]|uniref:Uncharacterized protein n=1 Tax=Sphaeroforma arctica JP610 TaxID=667725 RepID=A0A0L0FPT8_9EUKA|nr:hypothetical protein SARC_09051 [Sphaeroforma arctica JP610]KNC78526.1 hypothetical protein SARC_09051 [Sphaeroforma arctica JP610]|eukprot:XP_014152428.1 hypothetical protein SARC_09051 [Sphaeroforma arctica JP610]
MQLQGTVLAALASYVAGAELTASPANLQAIVASAASGDTINLEAGEYAISDPIVVDKKIIVKGADALFVVSDLAAPVFAFGNMEGYSSTLDGISVGTPGAEACDLAEPYALQANFSIEIMGATVSNNKVNLRTDVGIWHNERKLNDFYFADCHYAVDHPAKLTGGVYKLLGNCRSELDFSVAFDKLGGDDGCGTTIEDFATFTSYRAQVEAQWDEYVEKVDDENLLRLPVTREGNAVTNLLVQIDTVRNVAATINAQYESAEIEAAINLVDVGFFDGWNHSKIRLEIHLPAPFTISNSAGVVGRVEESFEAEVSAISEYVVDESCNGQAVGDDCIQNVVFDIVACDLTGEYSLNELMIACQETDDNGNPAVCPDIQSDPATVIFFIDTNNFCEVEEFELDALFELSIEVFDSDTYDNPETIFDLGSMSYWQITVDTSLSGVSLYNAEVTYVERTTDGDCSGFADYLGDVSEGNPEFTQTYDPAAQTISMPHQVTAQMACATSDRTGNAITMNYTVLVDYDDGSARRRRSLDGMNTRDAGEVAVDQEAGVRYTAEDLAQAAAVGAGAAAGATAAAHEEESNMMLIGGAIAAILLLCCCCCCFVVAGIVVMRRRSAKKEEQSIISHQSAMGFSDGGASTMSFGGNKV